MQDTPKKGKLQRGDNARYAKERKTAEGRQCKIRKRKENGRNVMDVLNLFDILVRNYSNF